MKKLFNYLKALYFRFTFNRKFELVTLESAKNLVYNDILLYLNLSEGHKFFMYFKNYNLAHNEIKVTRNKFVFYIRKRDIENKLIYKQK